MKSFVVLGVTLSLSTPVLAATAPPKAVEYQDQDTGLEGFVAVPKAKGKHPGILVIHDWMGVSTNTKMRIQKLSELGYVAFAADIFGKNNLPKNSEEASKLAGQYRADRPLLRKRVKLALEQLLKTPGVDPQNIAVMGYCFGGTTALELARSGADLKGTISFHGGLNTPTPKDASNIKGEVLALHGADDPYVPLKEVEDFEKEMRDAKVKWELVKYGNAVHSFTIKEAGNDHSKGAAYNAEADQKSWEAMKTFFSRIFAKK